MSLTEPATNSPQGLRETAVPTAHVVPVPAQMRRARDGSGLWWGEADTPGPPPVISPGVAAPVTVAVSPVRPGHAVTVDTASTAALSARPSRCPSRACTI